MVLLMTRMIAVTGPESCGKTELCEALRSLYEGAVVVPEFARTWLESQSPGYHYTFEDVVHIAREQTRLIQAARSSNARIAFCDSDFAVLFIWMSEVFGKTDPEVSWQLKNAHFDGVLLCSPDIPWEPDPLRENPTDRDRLFTRYEVLLQTTALPVFTISGLAQARVACAKKAVDKVLQRG